MRVLNRSAIARSPLLDRSATRQLWLVGLVALAFVGLMPPAAIDGRVSVLELSALLLAGALAVTRGVNSSTVGIPTPILALLVVMLASAAWSNDSWGTIRDVASYALLAVFAWLIVRTGGLRVIIHGTCVGIILVLLSSFALLVIDPSSAFYYESSGFQGIYANRNTMGFVLIQALPAVLALNTGSTRSIVGKWALLVILLAAMVATLSRTALLVAAVLVLLWLVLIVSRRWRLVIPVFGGLLAIGVAVALANLDRVLDLLGKTPSLNGRAVIWDAVIRLIPESPWLGFGWSRSWTPGSPHSEAVAERLQGQVVFHAHNEVLNWLVTLGVVGTAVVMALFVMAVMGGVVVVRRTTGFESMFPILLVVATLARGVTEISETNALGWLGLMLALFAIARLLVESESRVPRLLLIRRREADGQEVVTR